MQQHIAIIGGTSGIGLALTQLLVDEGHRVSVFSRSKPSELPSSASHYTLDTTSEELELPADFPESIDGFAYCPGSINLKPFNALRIQDYRDDLEVNVLGALKTIKLFLNKLKKGTDPSVVLFSTVAVQTGLPYHTSISAAKGAVEGITLSLAAELAPRVRVNCIAPSLTNTPLAGKLLSNDRQREGAEARHPLKRFGEPNDIAHMAAFLLSAKASWISGQVIHIDGGLSTLKT